VDVYINYPVRLHGVVLNWLSTGTTYLQSEAFPIKDNMCLWLAMFPASSDFLTVVINII
jgi:hypothetical protein